MKNMMKNNFLPYVRGDADRQRGSKIAPL